MTEYEYVSLLMTGKVTEEELIKCAQNYAETCRIEETPGRYIKNAENFLKDLAFEKYLPGQYKKPIPKPPKNAFCNFPQRTYNFDELERQLLRKSI